MTPTQRSLAYLRDEGYLVAIVELELTKGLKALIDADDVDRVSGNKWVASESGTRFYVVRGCGKTRQYLHRLIAGAQKGQCVDHINGNTLDNRKQNLRICTKQENSWNQKKRNNLYKGVTKHKDKFSTRLMINGKNLYFGLHKTPEEAAKAYDKAAIKHFGSFARLNNVTDPT